VFCELARGGGVRRGVGVAVGRGGEGGGRPGEVGGQVGSTRSRTTRGWGGRQVWGGLGVWLCHREDEEWGWWLCMLPGRGSGSELCGGHASRQRGGVMGGGRGSGLGGRPRRKGSAGGGRRVGVGGVGGAGGGGVAGRLVVLRGRRGQKALMVRAGGKGGGGRAVGILALRGGEQARPPMWRGRSGRDSGLVWVLGWGW